MRITAKVGDGLLRASKRGFGIDHPFAVAQRSQIGGEGGGLLAWFQVAEELEFTILEGLLERFEEQAPEQA